jgi:hypothetical protein
MSSESGSSADDPLAGLSHEEREGAAARAVEQVALTLAARR